MSSNPPDTESSVPLLKDPPALKESEAMRRMQDLLTTGKFSISDNVVFEYNEYSFRAQIMPDGSLKSKTQQHSSEPTNITSLPSKLYSSPSEFASDMAAQAVQLDEKATRPRGKISINGWSNCTVNRRSLATIRNEMLHERKNENAIVSKENVKDPVGAVVESTRSEPDMGESPASDRGMAEHNTAYLNPPLQDSRTEGHSKNPKGPERTVTEMTEDGIPSTGEKQAADQPMHSDLRVQRDFSPQPSGEAGHDSGSASRQESDHEARSSIPDTHMAQLKPREDTGQVQDAKGDGASVTGKLSSDERSVKDLSTEKSKEWADSVRTQDSAGDPHELQKPITDILDGPRELEGKKQSNQVNMTSLESATQKPEGAEIPSYLKPSEEEVNAPKDDHNKDREEIMNADLKEDKDVVMTDIPSADTPLQRETNTTREQVISSSRMEEVRDQEDNGYSNASLPKSQDVHDDDDKATPEVSDENNRTEEERFPSGESADGKESTFDNKSPQPTSSQIRSFKEVSDLQQEILGDSDSDEESLMENDQKPVSVLKKRSRPPSIHVNRKKKRTGEFESPETEGGTTIEGLHQKASKAGSDHDRGVDTTAGTKIEGTQLDPETMEAVAIAAQIEKEEASNRARRTTRLAAGKIKQVDYKAAIVSQAPRSISPGHDSEENDRNSNDNESPTETTRTTRRRATPNQSYPPQRSSRRVAKLRGGQEKEQSSNDEVENLAARSSSGDVSEGRLAKEVVDVDDTEIIKGQGSRTNGPRTDGGDRRRGRADNSVKKIRHAHQEEGDHDSQGRAYSTRASTRENSVVDAAEITDLGDPTDFPSEGEDIEDEEDILVRSNGHGFTIAELARIAEAVKTSGSVDPTDVLAALAEQSRWKAEDSRNQKVEAFLHEIIDSIQNLFKSLTLTPKEVNAEQMLSFLAAEEWRLRTGGLVTVTGIPRKPIAIHKKTTREDQMRSSLERSRRKEHRDVEEMRVNLEKEMECRRRAELDSLYVEIQVSEATRALSREKARCYRVEQETEKYGDMEADIRKRLEKAKILVGQLRGERDDSDGATSHVKGRPHQDETLGTEARSNGSFVTSPVIVTRNSTTSDDDVEMTDKNITTTSQRLLEMDRLRVLIASREAEAEEFQRICEKERMRFVNTLEVKNRLETEIYLYRSHNCANQGTGNVSNLPPSNRIGKENNKKSDHRGQSSHGNRGPGYPKQKSGVVRNGASAPVTTNLKNNALTSKPKPGSGKPSEVPKPAKRKPAVKNGGNGSDKM